MTDRGAYDRFCFLLLFVFEKANLNPSSHHVPRFDLPKCVAQLEYSSLFKGIKVTVSCVKLKGTSFRISFGADLFTSVSWRLCVHFGFGFWRKSASKLSYKHVCWAQYIRQWPEPTIDWISSPGYGQDVTVCESEGEQSLDCPHPVCTCVATGQLISTKRLLQFLHHTAKEKQTKQLCNSVIWKSYSNNKII